jgi:mannose-6-phosphate isomerase-like protein (cupin superfamily)
MDTKAIFNEFAKVFERKINKDYQIKVQFEIIDEENGIWQVEVKDGNVLVYNKEKIVPEETFRLSKETLFKLYNNELNTYTATLQAPTGDKSEMWALIDFKIKTEEKRLSSFDVSSGHYNFLCRFQKFHDFFSKDYPTKIIVDNKNGVRHSDVNAIALYSKMGKNLHIYYSIKKNEKMYMPPCEFCLYVLKGKGTIIMGNERFSINAKEYYHMIPKEKVYFENEDKELLEILYLCDEYYD